jgi:ADP-ribose pyrophosphatase YjhB (NUDIX family)
MTYRTLAGVQRCGCEAAALRRTIGAVPFAAMATDSAIRHAARALIVDAGQRVLLFRGELPDRDPWWYAPGGGLDEGETYDAALAREVFEETGLAIDVATLGAAVWTRDYLFTWQGTLERHLEMFFLIRIDNHEVDTTRFEPAESAVIRTYRWWRLDEILRSAERFSPVRLGEYLVPLLQGRMPEEPVAVGE